MRELPPIHPGEILLEEFIKPIGISRYRLAKYINLPDGWIRKICNGESGITADTALRLGRYFGTTVEFWTALQAHYETELLIRKVIYRLAK